MATYGTDVRAISRGATSMLRNWRGLLQFAIILAFGVSMLCQRRDERRRLEIQPAATPGANSWRAWARDRLFVSTFVALAVVFLLGIIMKDRPHVPWVDAIWTSLIFYWALGMFVWAASECARLLRNRPVIHTVPTPQSEIRHAMPMLMMANLLVLRENDLVLSRGAPFLSCGYVLLLLLNFLTLCWLLILEERTKVRNREIEKCQQE